VGDWVIAIGNALALPGGPTVTVGVVSALGRSLDVSPQVTLYDLIQTDTVINPGNSGGPLLNLRGELIGINTAVQRFSESGTPVEGMGFAIDMATASSVSEQLVSLGRVRWPWMGAFLVDLDPEGAARAGLPVREGVVVRGLVRGGPAEQSGLKLGDILLSMKGHKVDSLRELTRLLRQEFEAAFGGWSNPTAQQASPGTDSPDGLSPTTIYLVDHPEAAQSVIRAGHPTVPRNHPDYFALLTLNFVFGGQFSARLNQNLRQDKGYSYGFHSSISWYRQPSALIAGGSVQTDVTKESVQEVLREFQDIRGSRPLSAEELAAAQAGLLRGYPAGFERPAQVLGQMVQMVLHGLPNDYFRTVCDRLAAVSLDDVRQAAKERLQPDHLKLLVVGDRKVVEPGLRELDLPLVLLDADGQEMAQG